MNLKVRVSQASKLAAGTHTHTVQVLLWRKVTKLLVPANTRFLFVCLSSFVYTSLLTEGNCKVTKRKGKKVEGRGVGDAWDEHESSLISIGRIAFWRRLPDWALLEAYWAIQDAQHNKMLMVDTKHRADRISIRGLLTVKRGRVWKSRRALIPPASPSILEGGGVSVGGGGEKGEEAGTSAVLVRRRWQVQYLHLLDHIVAPPPPRADAESCPRIRLFTQSSQQLVKTEVRIFTVQRNLSRGP